MKRTPSKREKNLLTIRWGGTSLDPKNEAQTDQVTIIQGDQTFQIFPAGPGLRIREVANTKCFRALVIRPEASNTIIVKQEPL